MLPISYCSSWKKQKGPGRPRTLLSTGKFPILVHMYSVRELGLQAKTARRGNDI